MQYWGEGGGGLIYILGGRAHLGPPSSYSYEDDPTFPSLLLALVFSSIRNCFPTAFNIWGEGKPVRGFPLCIDPAASLA